MLNKRKKAVSINDLINAATLNSGRLEMSAEVSLTMFKK